MVAVPGEYDIFIALFPFIANTFQISNKLWKSVCIHVEISCHCVKSVQIRSFFWSVYSRNRTENTDQKNLCIWTFFMQCVFALLMPFMNRFCCRLWASRLTNIFTLMKIFLIFKGNMQKSDIGRQIKFHEIRNLWDFGLQKYCPRNFPGRH